MEAERVALGIVWYVCFIFSLTCHEAAHALAARLGGDLTASNAGQVTLNPAPHVRREPFGTILIPVLSFMFSGWMTVGPARPTTRRGNIATRSARRGWRSRVPWRIS